MASRHSVFNEYTPQLTASYELDFWGKNRAARDAALDTAKASRYDRETIALTVATSVALTYFEYSNSMTGCRWRAMIWPTRSTCWTV